eukprot:GHVO01006234.1.p1 GENE.GHVO01006234.1~~GHVO01006234.1.p1  ORF type:complete len:120 (+),score=2.04 GHVO01006234.1:3-362(+)
MRMLEFFEDYGQVNDQEAATAWYISLYGNYTAGRIDRSQKLSKNLLVPYRFTQEQPSGVSAPWYIKEYCVWDGLGWSVNLKQYNWKSRTLWSGRKDCSNLLEIDGCVVRWKNGLVSSCV